MKKEFKPDELRQTAEEIRSAIMPKTITPEMVGGTMLGVVDALGEVVEVLGEIPREHVRVKVRGYDGTAGVSGTGATVWLDVFHTKGYPAVAVPRQELTADEDGVVEFDVPHGFKYAVFSQIDGLGASFQLVFDAATDQRNITLWNLPIGVWALGHTDMAHYGDENDPDEWYYAVPFVTETFLEDIPEDITNWDVSEEKGLSSEGGWYIGILVSTADTSYAIAQNSKSEETMTWCGNDDYFNLLPCLDYYIENDNMPWDYEDAQEVARADMDGHLNCAKILGCSPTHTTARFCADMKGDFDEKRWLPSVGQLCIMQLNHQAINALMQQAIDLWEWDYKILPYKNEKGQWQNPSKDNWWWSSSVLSCRCSWVVSCNGDTYYHVRRNTNDVRAVSAFHFEY